MNNSGRFPECEKLHAVSAESQKLGEFLAWLQDEQGYTLCKFYEQNAYGEDEGYFPDRKSIQSLLAEYFEIDMDKVDEERRQMLKELRGE